MTPLIPGELLTEPGHIDLNSDLEVTVVTVSNKGDRPIQVGSHFHFYESNKFLHFDREVTLGKRLDIPAGTAIRFEPGDMREVKLVPLAGDRCVYGFNGLINGPLD